MVMFINDFLLTGVVLKITEKDRQYINPTSKDRVTILLHIEDKYQEKVTRVKHVKINEIPITFFGILATEARRIIEERDVLLVKGHIQSSFENKEVLLVVHEFHDFNHDSRKNKSPSGNYKMEMYTDDE